MIAGSHKRAKGCSINRPNKMIQESKPNANLVIRHHEKKTSLIREAKKERYGKREQELGRSIGRC